MQYFQQEIETMSKAEKRALQSERLVNIVKYAYENQTPYRAKMDAIKLKPSDIKSIDDIYKLPFTVKQDLRDAYPFGMMARPKSDLVRLHASSATTGKLTVAGYTQKDIDVWGECAARSLVMAGADEDSVVHVAYGYGLFTGGLGMHYGGEKLGACVVPASAGNTQKQIQLLADFGADDVPLNVGVETLASDGLDLTKGQATLVSVLVSVLPAAAVMTVGIIIFERRKRS